MSEYIRGDLGQTISTEYGPFITLRSWRVRRSLIKAYVLALDALKEDPPVYQLNVFVEGHYHMVKYDTLAEAEQDIARLDWIFKKEYGGGVE